jgi:hypothetical protein
MSAIASCTRFSEVAAAMLADRSYELHAAQPVPLAVFRTVSRTRQTRPQRR